MVAKASARRSAGRQFFLQEFDVQARGLQRIADFMGHGGGHLAQDDQELGALSWAASWACAAVSRRMLTTKSSFSSTNELRLISRANSWPSLRRPARERDVDGSPWGHKRVRPLREWSREKPLR